MLFLGWRLCIIALFWGHSKLKEKRKCKKCRSDFSPSPGLVNFCSNKCRYGREWTDEDKEIKSIRLRKRWESLPQKERDELNAKRCKFLTPEALQKKRELALNKFNQRPWDDLGIDGRRKRVIQEQDGKCNRCHLSEWFGEPLTLELEHKDGCNDNNSRENLECLCPNCHSLTPTWRGRNKRARKSGRVSDREISDAILSLGNIRQALLFVGLAAKGNNYKRATRIQKQMREAGLLR